MKMCSIAEQPKDKSRFLRSTLSSNRKCQSRFRGRYLGLTSLVNITAN